jgi:hypothetical protein
LNILDTLCGIMFPSMNAKRVAVHLVAIHPVVASELTRLKGKLATCSLTSWVRSNVTLLCFVCSFFVQLAIFVNILFLELLYLWWALSTVSSTNKSTVPTSSTWIEKWKYQRWNLIGTGTCISCLGTFLADTSQAGTSYKISVYR